MDHFEVAQVLKSFKILVDTREQDTPRALDRYEDMGVPCERATLNFGDYAGQVTLSSGPLYDTSETISPACVIERKMSLDELAACFTRSRDRFRREIERATEAGATVYLLVENGSYEAIIRHRYRSRYDETAFLASIAAWQARYGMRVVFCRPETSGALIKELLYREMKEMLGKGDLQ